MDQDINIFLNWFAFELFLWAVFIGLCLVTSTYSQTVTKLDGENMEISTVVTKKISIKRLREERDRLLWQQAESANRFNAVIYDLNTIISDFEKK